MMIEVIGSARLSDANKLSRFEAVVLVHLDAAYNLARWYNRRHRLSRAWDCHGYTRQHSPP